MADKFCKGCETMLGASEFDEDGRTSDGLATSCKTCRSGASSASRQMAELATEDVLGVQIMAAGERVRGAGSPPGGEVYQNDHLAQLAENTNAVMQRLDPFVKIGHSREQRLAKASGLYDDGERPATGWLRNLRVENGKLVTDLRSVPSKLAELVRSRAFAKVSPELRMFDGKPVIQAVALLGAKAPAFKTLDDIVALYNDGQTGAAMQLLYEDQPLDDDEVLTVQDEPKRDHAEGDVTFNPEQGAMDLMEDLSDSLNPPTGPDDMSLPRYMVRDVIVDSSTGGRALVSDRSTDRDLCYVVPFTIGDDGEPKPSQASEWTLAQQAWIERANAAAASYEERRKETTQARDTRAHMDDDKNTKTPEQLAEEAAAERKAYAESLGLPETATPEEITARATELRAAAERKPVETDGVKLSQKEYEELVRGSAAGASAAEELRIERRDTLVDGAIKAGKIAPAKREEWQRRYDENPTITKAVIEEMSVQETLLRAFGEDGQGNEGPFVGNADEERAYAEYCAQQGLPYFPVRTGGGNERREAVTP